MLDWQEQQDLKHLWQGRQIRRREQLLKSAVDRFMRRQVYPRRRRTGKLAAVWASLLPSELAAHSCLESLRNGQLRVLVDSAAHLYELNLLVQEGLLDELRRVCPRAALSQIKLVRGRWYHQDEKGNKIPDYP